MTRKGAIIELLIVTVGVLIALSFDSVREWRSNDALAAEARANLRNEIEQNKKQLDQTLTHMAVNEKDYLMAHKGAENLLAGKPFGTDKVNLSTRLAILSVAAYETAEITGAFRYMDYDEVRRFAGLYDLQAKYAALQDESVASSGLLGAPVRLADGPDRLSRPELEEWKRGLANAIGVLTVQGQIGTLLSQSYGAFLKDAESDE
jgi:hypothetical protein